MSESTNSDTEPASWANGVTRASSRERRMGAAQDERESKLMTSEKERTKNSTREILH